MAAVISLLKRLQINMYRVTSLNPETNYWRHVPSNPNVRIAMNWQRTGDAMRRAIYKVTGST